MSKGTKAIATIIGRMAEAINVRNTNSGKKIGSLRLAVNSGFGDNETTSWLDVVVFDEKKVEILERYTGKGSRIMVNGELRVRKWQDREGNDRWSTETIVSFDGSIELLDSKAESKGDANRDGQYGGSGDSRGNGGSTSRPSQSSSGSRTSSRPAFDEDLDDDVPF